MEENSVEKFFDEISIAADNAKNVYTSRIINTLKCEASKIENILKDIVDNKAEEYGLILGNDSSKKIELYSITSRVKEADSLREKIIRDQVFYLLLGQEKEDEIKDIILKSFDDLIGARFLVSLSCDCESIFGLLKDNAEQLKANGILFRNYDTNPEVMKNGRSIYRLKGEYNNYNFELQIKSKVDSAWADIEHMLFYKNFNFSYIQGTNKAVMNKIGDLLEQTDKLMVEVRNSQESYELAVEGLEFDQYLRKRYVNLVKDKLGSPYILTEHKELLFSLFNQWGKPHKKAIIALKNDPKDKTVLEFDIEENLKKETLYGNYIKMKQHSIELIVFECIYCEWKAYYDGEFKKLTKEEFKEYLGVLFSKIAENYKGDVEEIEIENYSEWFKEIFIDIMSKKELEFNNQMFVFNKKTMEQVAIYWKVRARNLPDFEEVEYQVKQFDELYITYLLNRENEDQYINEINDIFDSDDGDECKKFFHNMNKNIEEMYKEMQRSILGKNKGKHTYNMFYEISVKKQISGGEI